MTGIVISPDTPDTFVIQNLMVFASRRTFNEPELTPLTLSMRKNLLVNVLPVKSPQ